MNLTRRSFVKKSAYSAAAVTILGAGVALGQAGSGKKTEILQIDVTATVDLDEEGIGTGDTAGDAVAAATVAVQKYVAGHSTTAIDITEGDVNINDQLLSITSSAVPPATENGAVINTVFFVPRTPPATGFYAKVRLKIKAGKKTRQTYNWGLGN